MNATIQLPLKRWQAPNFAIVELPPGLKQDGPKELPSFAVADLSQEALDALAGAWLRELYEKAKKPSPWELSHGAKP